MKKLIIIMILLSAMSLTAIEHGLIVGTKLGYNLLDNTITYPYNKPGRVKSYRDFNDSIFIELTLGYRIGGFRFIGTYENTLLFDEIDNYIPVQDNYKIQLTYTFKDIVIGFEHWCDHPVVTSLEGRKYLENSVRRQIFIKFYKEF